MMKMKRKAEEDICWRIQRGDINMWWDNWTGKGALALWVPDQFAATKEKVSNYIQNSFWDIEKLADVLPEELVQHISSIPIGDNSVEDFAVWEPGIDGMFSTKSAVQVSMQHRPSGTILSKVWHKHLPFKMSFLLWRLIQKRLPFDDVVSKRFGFSITSACVCCQNKENEKLKHVFLTSEVAVKIWKVFCGPLGISLTDQSIENNLWNWWSSRPRNEVHKMIPHITPVMICWEIWRQRCACKYGDKKRMWARKMETQICWNIVQAVEKNFPGFDFGNSWAEICERVQKLRPVQTWKVVRWSKSTSGVMKINTDGSFDGSKAGIGGITRDNSGKLCGAFSISVSCSSNNQAEALAPREGLKWAIRNGVSECILERDSMLIVDSLKKRTTANLKLRSVIEELVQLMGQLNCTISHCFREGNNVADALVKAATKRSLPVYYSEWQDLPDDARGAYQLDKAQLPSLRLIYDKANFFVG